MVGIQTDCGIGINTLLLAERTILLTVDRANTSLSFHKLRKQRVKEKITTKQFQPSWRTPLFIMLNEYVYCRRSREFGDKVQSRTGSVVEKWERKRKGRTKPRAHPIPPRTFKSLPVPSPPFQSESVHWPLSEIY